MSNVATDSTPLHVLLKHLVIAEGTYSREGREIVTVLHHLMI